MGEGSPFDGAQRGRKLEAPVISETDLKEIKPKAMTALTSPEHVRSGVPIPKAMRVRTFSPGDWEEFLEEWATSLDSRYLKVRRFGGAGDMGVDIAGFCTDQGFQGTWDNFQCKRYGHPLRPGDVWVEIGKIIYYAYRGEYIPPRKHYFICSQDIGTSLEKLLNSSSELKIRTLENWEKHCKHRITSTEAIDLTGALLQYFDAFEFEIFSSRSLVELIDGHSKTGYHAVRFGGGLPSRPDPAAPPELPAAIESRYIRQLLTAYGEHVGENLSEPAALATHTGLKRDFLRQRERFYHAESLRNFARDTVPEGTFDALQSEVYHGVVDICEGFHASGFERMKATVAQASVVAATSNPLVSVIKTQDRQGICHQLANDDRLTWVPDHE